MGQIRVAARVHVLFQFKLAGKSRIQSMHRSFLLPPLLPLPRLSGFLSPSFLSCVRTEPRVSGSAAAEVPPLAITMKDGHRIWPRSFLTNTYLRSRRWNPKLRSTSNKYLRDNTHPAFSASLDICFFPCNLNHLQLEIGVPLLQKIIRYWKYFLHRSNTKHVILRAAFQMVK